jgi:hypothetical protein
VQLYVDWILNNPGEVATLITTLVAIAVAVFAAVKIGGFRQGLLALMLRFERARRQGKLNLPGPQVMDLVISWAMLRLVPRLPVWLRFYITPLRIRMWAQALFDGMLDLLDDGQLNGTRPTIPDDEPPEQPPAA